MKKILACLVCLSMLLLGVLCSCEAFGGSKYTYTDLGDSYELTDLGDSTDTEIVIPETYKGKPVTSIGDRAFYNNYISALLGGKEAPEITSITLPESITNIGKEAFAGNMALTSVNIPASVKTIGEGAFYDCRALTSITIPEGVTEIKEGTFSSCGGLQTVTLPSTLTKIGANAFASCKSLTAITLPAGVTEISASCFSECTQLASFTISENIVSIGEYAFEDCVGLTELTIPDTVETLEGYIFSGTGKELVISVCYDSEPPEGWNEKWYSGMSGKVINTSEVYMTNVVEPNKVKAAAIQAQIDACNESYQALNNEIGRLNEASKPYQASGNADMVKYYRDEINACKEQQRNLLNRVQELKEELEKYPTTGQINN